jgi:S1-C subfamily serine protease
MHKHRNGKSAGAGQWRIWLLALAAVAVLGRASVADLSKQQQENIKDGVVLIVEKGFSKSHGSGLVVSYPQGNKDSIYVITNRHVIADLGLSQVYLHIHPKWLRNDKEIPVKRIVLPD